MIKKALTYTLTLFFYTHPLAQQDLAQLEVSLNSLASQLKPQAQLKRQSFGSYLQQNFPDLLVNKDKFDNSKGIYQIKVLEQTGLTCARNSIVNNLWFANALSAYGQDRLETTRYSINQLNNQTTVNGFITNIDQALNICSTQMAGNTQISAILKYFCTNEINREINDAKYLENLKRDYKESPTNIHGINFSSICPRIYNFGFPFIRHETQKFETVDRLADYILSKASDLEQKNLNTPENKQAMKIIILSKGYLAGLGNLYSLKNKTSNGFTFLNGIIYVSNIHWETLSIVKTNNTYEYFLLNSINNNYLSQPLEIITSLYALLLLSNQDFSDMLIRYLYWFYIGGGYEEQDRMGFGFSVGNTPQIQQKQQVTKPQLFSKIRDVIANFKTFKENFSLDLKDNELYKNRYRGQFLFATVSTKNEIEEKYNFMKNDLDFALNFFKT